MGVAINAAARGYPVFAAGRLAAAGQLQRAGAAAGAVYSAGRSHGGRVEPVGRVMLDPAMSGSAMRLFLRYASETELAELARANGAGDMKSAAEVFGEYECKTCAERKYQDGSNDPGVSFKTPTKISPDQAPAMVRGHEMEHVVRERAKAAREGREVVRQSVVLHSSVCPECGRPYISGGMTTTVTRGRRQPDGPQPAEAQEKDE